MKILIQILRANNHRPGQVRANSHDAIANNNSNDTCVTKNISDVESTIWS